MSKQKTQVDIRDYRVSFGLGMLIGILIVGTPQLIGVAILLGVMVGSIYLVEKGRI